MKPVLCLFVATLLIGAAHALPGPASQRALPDAAIAPPVANPAVALRAGVDRLLAFLRDENQPSPDALAAFLNAEIAPFFDFEHMAKSAGGRMYEMMDEGRRQALIDGIRQSFLGKMAEKLAGYDRQQVRFLPPRAGNDGRTVQLSAAIINPGRYPARLDFRLYRGNERWRVYDVAANGQSAIVHYRREIMRQTQQRRMRQMRPAMRPGMPQGYVPRRMP